MPDRLGDIINVKDWGARGDGRTDDRPAIQAAIQHCMDSGGGRVVFPAGTYKLISAPGRLVVGGSSDGRVELVGCGQMATILYGKHGADTFLISALLDDDVTWGTYDNIGRVEGLQLVYNGTAPTGSGSIKITGQTVAIKDVRFGNYPIGIDASACQGALITDTTGLGGLPFNPVNVAPPSLPGAIPGTVGIYIGSHVTVQECSLTGGWEIVYALSGYAPSLIACRTEVDKIGVRVGWAPAFTAQTSALASSGTNALPFSPLPSSGLIVGRLISDGGVNIPSGTTITGVNTTAGTVLLSNNITPGNITAGTTITFKNETPAYGFMVANVQTEATDIAFDLYNAHGGMLTGAYTQGQVGSCGYALISGVTWSGGTAHVTTAEDHHLPVGTYPLQLGSAPAGFLPSYGYPPGWCIATRTGANTFDYVLPDGDPGVYPGGMGWSYPQYYTLRCRNVTECAIISNNFVQNSAYGSVDLDYTLPAPYSLGSIADGGGASYVKHRNNVFWGAITDGYILPSNTNLAGWDLKHLGGVASKLDGIGTWNLDTVRVPTPAMTFAGLPGQAGVYQDGPYEAQEFNITDGSLFGSPPPTAAGFADRVIGGGNGHYRVRYDGSVWRRIA
jgi:hypothetical protein